MKDSQLGQTNEVVCSSIIMVWNFVCAVFKYVIFNP